MLPNPRTYVSENGYSFSKKTGKSFLVYLIIHYSSVALYLLLLARIEVLLTKVTPLREAVELIEVGDAMEE